MSETSLRIERLDELRAALKAYPADVQRGLRIAMRVAGEQVRSGMAKYPTRRFGAEIMFKSNKHRRGFFGLLRAGKIEIPYRRGQSPGSQRLGASWAVRVKSPAPGHIKGIVGTRASYAQLVQGPAQTGMHKTTGWKTLETVLKEKGSDIQRVFAAVVQKALARIAARGGWR